MGAEVEQARYTREQRQRYREKVRRDLDVFERMLGHSQFEFDRPMTGLEIELNLVNGDLGPKLDNKTILAQIADPDYQTELARFTLTLGVPDTGLVMAKLVRSGGWHLQAIGEPVSITKPSEGLERLARFV